MKKLLAIVLALMLVTASAALAETATVLTVANPVITVTEGGQTNTAELTGTTLTIAAGMAGEEPVSDEDGFVEDNRVPTVQFDIVKDGETLLSGELQVIGERMIVNLEGLSRPLAADMSMAGGMAGQGYKKMFASLPDMAKNKLPKFQGVNIPKIDLLSIASSPVLGSLISFTTTETTASFELPAEMVSAILSMILQQVPAEALQSMGLQNGLDDILGGGFALKGDIADYGESAALTVGVYPAVDGVTADEAFLTITFTSAENSDVLAVDVSMGGQSANMGQLALSSIPEQAELNLGLNLMSGQMTLNGSLYPQDGAQVAALELNVPGQKVNASLTYGENEGADYTDFAISVENQAAVDIFAQTTGDGNGNEDGACTLTVDSYGETPRNVVIDSEISQRVTEGFAFRNIANSDAALDTTRATEEEMTQLNEEMNAIMGRLLAAFNAVAPAA